MSTIYKYREGPTFIQTCVTMDKPIKYNLQRLAALKHTTLSHLVNLAAEEYLRKYVSEAKGKEAEIVIQCPSQ